ncbi:putative DNA glycosylase At3g47830 isoform X2 [Diospyros lotus]|uniref:putative DNA glycosylase At3g47830 isoform X2 n=1 Tax=Diospyros lotus TaxID=55363 RepID=UPI00225A1C46|nr:putative DNA glycosylase At3g47830 isoform X2 [Diospyros lotus]
MGLASKEATKQRIPNAAFIVQPANDQLYRQGMHSSRKRKKQTQPQRRPSPRRTNSDPTSAGAGGKEPYPSHPRPTAEECRSVRLELLALHGFPEEFAKYRSQRPDLLPLPLTGGDQSPSGPEGSGPAESVLDGLVSVILSQNTTDSNSQRAFASLKSAFPTWEDVLVAESKSIENAIRCGGLAPTKASCIKNILSCLLEKRGKLCLEYLRDFSVDQIKAELSQFKGIGPKTVACVLMFHLQQDDFPVDTHVFQIAKAVGWVPEVADTKKTYLHLNQRIPNELKFDLNCLLFTHGKLCKKCTKRSCQQEVESNVDSCPLLSMFLPASWDFTRTWTLAC